MEGRRDDLELIQRYCASRDPTLREEIILRHVPLVHYVLGRLGISPTLGADYEDAAGQGLLGLIEAVDHYDPSHGAQFSTYATLRIRGKVLDHLRASDWLSRAARKRARLVQDGIATLWEQLQRMPTEEELASHLNLDLPKVQQALVDSSRILVSLDAMTHLNGEDEAPLDEIVADQAQEEPSAQIEEQELKRFLTQALQQLPEREQMILALYYYEELTFREIGEVLDISESRVCQLHGRIVTALQAMLAHYLRSNLTIEESRP
jgi:RNA polymerase sigma factor for flagellar operon FliA